MNFLLLAISLGPHRRAHILLKVGQVLCRVADPNHFSSSADPDPYFHFHEDPGPDPNIYFNADLDHAPHQSDAILRPLPQTLWGSTLSP